MNKNTITLIGIVTILLAVFGGIKYDSYRNTRNQEIYYAGYNHGFNSGFVDGTYFGVYTIIDLKTNSSIYATSEGITIPVQDLIFKASKNRQAFIKDKTTAQEFFVIE